MSAQADNRRQRLAAVLVAALIASPAAAAVAAVLPAAKPSAVVDVAELLFPIDAPPPEGDCGRLVEAATSLMDVLVARAAAARTAGASLVGKRTTLQLHSRRLTGTVRKVTDKGLVVASTHTISGARLEHTAPVPWSALAPAQMDALARDGGWAPAPDEAALATACIALAAGRVDDAEHAVNRAPGHILAPRLKTVLAAKRAARAYDAAITRARKRAKARDYAAAAAAAAEALALRPDDPVARELQAEARYGTAVRRAIACTRRAAWKAAVEASEEALALRPADERATKLHRHATTMFRSTTMRALPLAPGVEIDLVYVEPGTFTMGGRGDPVVSWEGLRKPEHEVEITRGFYLGTFEVTRGQFAAFVEATGHVTDAEKEGFSTGRRPDGSFGRLPGSTWRDTNIYTQTDDHPVTNVSWWDCAAFCKWVAKTTGRTVRLPTEAEWEFACRAGTNTWYFSGDDETGLRDYCWYSAHAGWTTHPVGGRKPNAWGLYDMHGNVYEYVADWYGKDYYERSPRKDPPGPASGSRVVSRGGGWHGGAECCGSHIRRLEGRIYREPDLGFRIAVTAPRR